MSFKKRRRCRGKRAKAGRRETVFQSVRVTDAPTFFTESGLAAAFSVAAAAWQQASVAARGGFWPAQKASQVALAASFAAAASLDSFPSPGQVDSSQDNTGLAQTTDVAETSDATVQTESQHCSSPCTGCREDSCTKPPTATLTPLREKEDSLPPQTRTCVAVEMFTQKATAEDSSPELVPLPRWRTRLSQSLYLL